MTKIPVLFSNIFIFIHLVVISTIITDIESQLLDTCIQMSVCSCMFTDGSIVDLTPLGKKSGGPRFGYEESVDQNPDWEYAANVCFGFNDHECKNQVVCQRSTDEPIKYFPIGNADSATWNSDGTQITYTETYEGTSRTSLLTLECDANGKQNNPTFIREGEKTQEYHFTLKSICACAGGCKAATSGSGLSVGSILCIVFSALVLMYLAIGMLFMKCVRKAEGKEVIPHVETWMNLPGYIKDGTMFVVKLVKPGNGQSGYDTDI